MNVIIVDSSDTPLGVKERSLLSKDDIHRVASMFLVNEKGEYLLCKRASSVPTSPGRWGASAAGTIDEGETYRSNITKELSEEIGVNIPEEKLREGRKFFLPDGLPRFNQTFFATVDSNILLSPSPVEVAETRWVSVEDLQRWVSRSPQDFVALLPLVVNDLT